MALNTKVSIKGLQAKNSLGWWKPYHKSGVGDSIADSWSTNPGRGNSRTRSTPYIDVRPKSLQYGGYVFEAWYGRHGMKHERSEHKTRTEAKKRAYELMKRTPRGW